MEPHDLVLSKLGAGREKDLESVSCTEEHRQQITARVDALFPR